MTVDSESGKEANGAVASADRRHPGTPTSLPTGTVTFLFTDIEGSTRLLQRIGPAYERLQHDHGRILRAAIAAGGGSEVDTEGDSFFAAFATPTGAVNAAVAAQRDLAAHDWPHGGPVRIRMGVHTGEGVVSEGMYLGLDVNRAARIAAAGHGGQVLLSDATRALVEAALPPGVTLRDLGEHRLKDLARPERLYDLAIEGLPTEFPPLRSLGGGAKLPLQVTSFVGRDRELSDLTDLLASARLVTLTGPGGTGKTRLAVEVARLCMPRYPSGAVFCDLTPLARPDLVPTAIADGLGVIEEPGRPIVETISDHLRDRDVLLVLDNFEHLLDAAPVAATILGAAAGVAILATSRVPLRIYGEHEYEVAPLDVPDTTAGATDAESLSAYPALALFVDRARAVRADFRITDDNARVIADICARLDGLPLAIELAASRVKLFGPEALRARLENRLGFLTGGSASRPERQRTLRGAIEWSYDLLDDAERRLLERVSVFAGGFTLDAVEQVCDAGAELGIEVVNGIASLVDKSLVRRAASADDEPRFTLLETIREFAAERLDARGETDAIANRHAEHFGDLALRAEPHLVAEDQAAWLERVQQEHDNLRTALRWAVDGHRAELAVRTSAALWRFWQQRGHLTEARRWLEQVLTLDGASDEARFAALIAAGGIAYWQSDVAGAERHYEEARATARSIGDRHREVEVLYDLGYIPGMRHDYAGARVRFEEVQALAAAIGDRETEAHAEAALAWTHMLLGNYDDSIRLAAHAMDYFRKAGNRFEVIDQIATTAQARRLRGDLAEARVLFLEALRLLGEAKDLPMTGRVLFMLAATASAQGRHEDAMRIWGAAETIRETSGGIGPLEGMRIPEAPALARDAIGEEPTQQALAEGRTLGPGAVIARERERDAPSTAPS
jgi:predicted ATPase/class 3 adenylate cyclase